MDTNLKKAFDLINKNTVTVRFAAQFLVCARSKIFRLLKSGEIEGQKIGEDYRIVSKSLDAYAKRQIQKVD